MNRQQRPSVPSRGGGSSRGGGRGQLGAQAFDLGGGVGKLAYPLLDPLDLDPDGHRLVVPTA